MRILAIDSSGKTASVAVWEDDLILAEFSIQAGKTHSQTLLPMLEDTRDKSEIKMETIDAIAVTSGPGSFTGLRIGSATAKGLGFALEKPIIPVPTLKGMAYNLYGTDKLVCPLMDARRNQVYTGLFEFVKKEEKTECSGAQGKTGGINRRKEYVLHVLREQCAVSIEEILDNCNEIGREVVFLGDGIPVFEKTIQEKMQVPYSFAPAHMNRQRAAAAAALAAEYFRQGKKQTAAEHAPEYLRLSQAERVRNECG